MADQVPHRVRPKDIQKARLRIEADQTFVQAMEEHLPRGAMVFQMPVVPFPEGGGQNRMWGYESLRPYLWSRELRFSHGTCKGREWDSWQRDVQILPPEKLVATLERYGFGAIYIDQGGYPDKAAQLLEGFRRAGRGRVITNETSELVCVFLEPATNPVLPELLSDFRQGWYAMETQVNGTSMVWSKGSAAVTIDNLTNESLVRYLKVYLVSPRSRKVEMRTGGQLIWSAQLRPGEWENAHDLRLALPPGKTVVDLATDAPPSYAGGKDSRRIAFMLANYRLEEQPSTPNPLAPRP